MTGTQKHQQLILVMMKCIIAILYVMKELAPLKFQHLNLKMTVYKHLKISHQIQNPAHTGMTELQAHGAQDNHLMI